MISTLSRVIDDHTIAVSQLSAMAALKMSARLGRLLGTPLARAISTIDITNLGGADVSAIGAALLSLFEGVTPDEMERLAKDLLTAATIDGQPFFPASDALLAGRIDTYYKILGFALEANYGSFFDVLRALGVSAKAKVVAAPSPSPKS